MLNWLKRGINEDTVQAQRELSTSDKQWQSNLTRKEFSDAEKAIEMDSNYKALTNLNTRELRNIACKSASESPRPSFNKEALKETKELLDNQTSCTKPLTNKEEIKEKLEEERSKKRGLFW
jgi:hypothetical protein